MLQLRGLCSSLLQQAWGRSAGAWWFLASDETDIFIHESCQNRFPLLIIQVLKVLQRLFIVSLCSVLELGVIRLEADVPDGANSTLQVDKLHMVSNTCIVKAAWATVFPSITIRKVLLMYLLCSF